MTLEKAKQELEKFVQLKTTLRPAFVDVLLNAEEVVRCKDCRFHEHEEAGMVWCPNVVGSWMAEDGFCSMGERREDERK